MPDAQADDLGAWRLTQTEPCTCRAPSLADVVCPREAECLDAFYDYWGSKREGSDDADA